jgi:hypothetical protein
VLTDDSIVDDDPFRQKANHRNLLGPREEREGVHAWRIPAIHPAPDIAIPKRAAKLTFTSEEPSVLPELVQTESGGQAWAG